MHTAPDVCGATDVDGPATGDVGAVSESDDSDTDDEDGTVSPEPVMTEVVSTDGMRTQDGGAGRGPTSDDAASRDVATGGKRFGCEATTRVVITGIGCGGVMSGTSTASGATWGATMTDVVRAGVTITDGRIDCGCTVMGATIGETEPDCAPADSRSAADDSASSDMRKAAGDSTSLDSWSAADENSAAN